MFTYEDYLNFIKENNILRRFQVYGFDIVIKRDKSVLDKYGFKVTAIYKSTIDNQYLIFVDDKFEKLSKSTQDFFILHEIGHLINGDLNSNINYIQHIWLLLKRYFSFKVSRIELEADNYAIRDLLAANINPNLQDIYKDVVNVYPELKFNRELKNRVKKRVI